MSNFIKIVSSIFLLFTLSSCAIIEVNQVYESALNVRIYNMKDSPNNCTFIADIVGTEGRWYSSLYIANKDLVLGAISDLKNQTSALEADAVIINEIMTFATSVTIYAQAFDCQGVKLNHYQR
ncbi:MAG: DUF4156 domain-containing protein [Oleispira sp.]|nr:DUF4156 domain-containing protein [Oleispira sp.]MBL4880008.1 DUF4156 domain-containing protein [Oleispira sp.]